MTKTQFDFNIIGDPEIFKRYKIEGYPKNLFIDKDGNVFMTKEGTPSSRKSGGDEWTISVFDDYSAILDKMLSD